MLTYYALRHCLVSNSRVEVQRLTRNATMDWALTRALAQTCLVGLSHETLCCCFRVRALISDFAWVLLLYTHDTQLICSLPRVSVGWLYGRP